MRPETSGLAGAFSDYVLADALAADDTFQQVKLGRRTLQQGDRGDAVRQLQRALNRAS